MVNSTLYVLVTGMLDYGTRDLGFSHGTMLAAVLIGNALQLAAVPLFAEMFTADVRYSGASLGYQVASVVGGLAPVIMVLLVERTHTSASIAAYVVLLAMLALASLAGIRPSAEAPTARRDAAEPQLTQSRA